MASRIWTTLQTLGKRRHLIEGSFAPNGSSALVAADVKGKGFSVAYISTGLYRVTFEDKYVGLESFTLGLMLNAADDKMLQFGPYDPSAKTLDIRSYDISGGALADIAANANNRISFQVIFNDSTPGP